MNVLGHLPKAPAARKSPQGFTLIELLVVAAIIMVLSAIALTSQRSFNQTILLSNTAYDFALALRSAETYGLGSRVSGPVSNVGYGIHVQKQGPNTFTLFADSYPPPSSTSCHPVDPTSPIFNASSPAAKPGDCAYESSQGETVTTFTLGNGVTVANFCAEAGGVWTCEHPKNALTSLDIVFDRPNPDPFISENGVYSASPRVSTACFKFIAPSGGTRYVSVSISGNISANATSCP